MQLFTGKDPTVQQGIVDDKVDLNELENPAVLAIEDCAEGEPDDDDAHALAMARIDTSMTHKWGPFVFTYVVREATSSVTAATQWQVTCPYHKDKGDATGTTCKKTITFHGDADRDEAAKMLRHWCVLAFSSTSRASGDDAHLKKLRNRQLVGIANLSDAELDQMLADNLRLAAQNLVDTSSSSSNSSSDSSG